jgi:hypothetical protein
VSEVDKNEMAGSLAAFWIAFALLIFSLGCPDLRTTWLVDMGCSAIALALAYYDHKWISAGVIVAAYALLLYGAFMTLTNGCFGVP